MVSARPKLLAVDLDGTLLDSTGRPHALDVRALRAAIAAGVHVSIITGRLYSGTRAVAEKLGLNAPVGCADGSHIVHAGTHATLVHYGVEGAVSDLVRTTLARAGVTAFVFAKDAIGHDAAGAPFVGYVSTWSTDVRVAESVYEHELWATPDGITAAVAIGERTAIKRAADALLCELGNAVFVASFPIHHRSHAAMWAMIVRASVGTKGTALRWIAARQGVAIEDTVCVGDWLNDVPMFEAAGRSFAMGQAPVEVRSKATDILLETVAEGGGIARVVAEVLGVRVD